ARFRKAFNTAFNALINKYKHGVMLFIKHKWLMWATLCLSLVALVLLMNTTKTGLVPDEDQGTIMVNVTTAPGTSLSETNEVMMELGRRLRAIPQIRDFNQVAGYGMIAGQGNSYGMCIVKLKDWEDRPDKQDAVNAVIGQIYARTADMKNAQIFAVAPPMISGYGTSTGFNMYLQDRAGGDISDFYNVYLQFIGALNQRPEIERAYSTFSINFPQYIVDIDAAKAKRAGISPTDILATLSGYYGGQYVSNINRFSKVYRVMIQADPKYRLDTESLNNVFVRMQNGEMAPISQLVELTKVYGPEVLNRFNLYNSIAVTGTSADGYSSGDAIEAIRETAARVLPKGYSFEFGGITREEAQTGSNTTIIFGICILLIYLILSALYESFIIPFAVILSVPCGLMGSFLFAKFMGLENNIYLQTGLIMLIGLLAKTAILLTEYAGDRRRAGMSLTQAAVSAAKVRLRPILMTVLTMVFGMIPLVLASGVGANGNSTLGTGVVGGMIVGTLALLFLVPTLFIVFQ
ncbi:MAG: efflux RND transporter permease subunit, partial [Alistipes sp.]|nr:efflux RND transporter permease subunit [Alistipes sp.]